MCRCWSIPLKTKVSAPPSRATGSTSLEEEPSIRAIGTVPGLRAADVAVGITVYRGRSVPRVSSGGVVQDDTTNSASSVNAPRGARAPLIIARDDLVRDFAQVFAPYIGLLEQRIPERTGPRDERGGRAGPHRTGDVPGVCRDEADATQRDTELARRCGVRLWRGLEPLRVVGAQRLVEQIPDAGVRELRLLDLAGRVGERRDAETGGAQSREALPHLGVRRQSADLAEDRLLVRLRHRHATALRGQRERRAEVRAEIEIRPGHGQEQRGLQHRREPLAPHGRVPEDALEMWVERGEIEQRFIHVEYEHAVARRSHRAES